MDNSVYLKQLSLPLIWSGSLDQASSDSEAEAPMKTPIK